jgi:transglutaminase-like putative cysteine protease
MKKIIFICLMLIYSFSVHADSLAERWALTVPSVTENNMSQLVHYLTKGINNKYEQAKAIAVWIAAHVAYDNYSYSAMTGGKVSNRLQKGEQSAEEVFKTRIGTCEGYANLYSKMLGMAGIQNEQVRGFALDGLRNNADARKQIKREKVGHVWNKVNIPGRKSVLVDITWMSRGQTAQTDKRLTQHIKNRELRKIKRERPTYSYNMTYFDFTYKDRQKHGEYRFSLDRQILK